MDAEIEKLDAAVLDKVEELRAEERKRSLSYASVQSSKSAQEQSMSALS